MDAPSKLLALVQNYSKMDLTIKWSGQEYKVTGLSDTNTVRDLKHAISKDTGVLPERQKLLGLKYKGK